MVPAPNITHLEGKGAGQVRPQSIVNLWSSRKRLYQKHYPSWKRLVAAWLIRTGMKRKIRQARHSTTLTDADCNDLINAYQKVIELFGGSAAKLTRELNER